MIELAFIERMIRARVDRAQIELALIERMIELALNERMIEPHSSSTAGMIRARVRRVDARPIPDASST